MFQCIIQQKNGWIHPYNPDNKDVFPGIEYYELRMFTQIQTRSTPDSE